jgi:hypothetical protein
MSADGYRNHGDASVYRPKDVSMAVPITNSGVIMADRWSRHAFLNRTWPIRKRQRMSSAGGAAFEIEIRAGRGYTEDLREQAGSKESR